MTRQIVSGLALALVACGGRFDPAQVQAKLAGSYELTFGSVAASEDGRPRPYGGNGTVGVSQGKRARLDIADDGKGGLKAALTAEWGQTGAFDVAVSEGKATLSGSAYVHGASPGGSTSDDWVTIQLTLGADGAPTGAVTLAGNEQVSSGDVGWGYAITGTAQLAKDTIAPEAKGVSVSMIAPSALLPWEPVLLEASEPLDVKAWTSSISASSQMTWSADTETWSGATLLHGIRPTWEGGTTVRVNVGANKDRVGNASSATSFDAPFLDLGAPRAAFDFSQATVASWGKVAPATGSVCESGTCMDVGPAKLGWCDAERTGFAGRLATTGKKTMVVRYRVELTPSNMWGGTQPTGQPLLAVELATPGHAGQQKTIDPVPMTKGADDVWKSDWSTARLELPGAEQVGFALRTAGHYGGCNFGPYPGDMGNVRLVVQSVAAE